MFRTIFYAYHVVTAMSGFLNQMKTLYIFNPVSSGVSSFILLSPKETYQWTGKLA